MPCGQEVETEETLEEEVGQEARTSKGQNRIIKPSQQEVYDHMRTHFPYRRWCTQCVEGKERVEETSTRKILVRMLRKYL